MLRNFLNNASREWSSLNNAVRYKNSSYPLSKKSYANLVGRILTFEENQLQGQIKNVPENVEKEKYKISKITKFFEGFKHKDGKHGFDRKLKEDVCLWMTSVLAVSSLLVGHKWLHCKQAKSNCALQYVNKDIVQTVLYKRSLNNALALGINPQSTQPLSSNKKQEVHVSVETKEETTKEKIDKEVDKAIEKFQKTAYACNGTLLNKLALRYKKINKHENAFRLFQAASSFDHVTSMYNLAICYENGSGVTKSIEQAMGCYKTACEKGHVKSMYNLASLYYETGSYNETVENNEMKGLTYMKMAADHNLEKAQLFVALKYVEQNNHAESIKYFKMAASQENVHALYNLGKSYEHGLGVEKDCSQAVKYYRKAALLNHLKSIIILADSYQHGTRGLAINLEEALRYYQLAKQHGHHNVTSNIELVCYEIAQRNEEMFLNLLNKKNERKQLPFNKPVDLLFQSTFHKSPSLPLLKLYNEHQIIPSVCTNHFSPHLSSRLNHSLDKLA